MIALQEFFYAITAQGGWFLWLIHRPFWLMTAIIVGSGVLMTVVGILLTHNYVITQRLIANNLVATAKFVFMSQVFTGMLAFIMVEAGTRYANAESHIFNETEALRNLSQVVGHMPKEVSRSFQKKVAVYAKAVVETEWTRMESGDDSPFATEAFNALIEEYFSIEPHSDHEQSLLRLGNLIVTQVVEGRTSRLNNNVSQDIATLTWVSMTGLVGITIMFNWFFGSPNLRSQLAMGVVLSICILSCVVMTFLLGNPFAGETAVEPTPFRQFYL
ncbi:conserved membrane hypothetical protein [Candidatus Terasakiella magnetica]|nr:conserved membrane hypothetical protein [Candidatus Terasakiella magnetica]